jgi:hypothetical protein
MKIRSRGLSNDFLFLVVISTEKFSWFRTMPVQGMKSLLVAQDAALSAGDPEYKPVLDPKAASRMSGI